MEILAQIGGGAYTLVAFVIGLRLILLSRRTRRLPELLVGAGVFLLAGLGYPLSAAAREVPGLPAATRDALGATAGLLALVGVTANTAFTWLLFRRGVLWANALLAFVGLGAAALFVTQTVSGGWTRGGIFWSGLAVGVTVSFGWGLLECARYHLLLRRRLRLDLADPVVTDRFRLYAAATGLAVLTNLMGSVFWWLGVEMLTHPLGGLLLFGFGTSSSVLMMLAFLPPPAYTRWLRRRHRERHPDAVAAAVAGS